MILSAEFPENRGPQINRSLSAVAILSTLAVIGRLTARRLKRVSLGPSDYTLLVGWLAAWGMGGILFKGEFIQFQGNIWTTTV